MATTAVTAANVAPETHSSQRDPQRPVDDDPHSATSLCAGSCFRVPRRATHTPLIAGSHDAFAGLGIALEAVVSIIEPLADTI